MKFPLVILYNIIAFNITAVALSVQTDFPVLWHASIPVKVIVWAVAVLAWAYSYKNRRKVFELK
jgi:hypothetical protein